MRLTAEAKCRKETPEHGQLIEVVRKDFTGRILRISRCLFKDGAQWPISETIFDSKGNSTLYLYNETGEDVRQILPFNKWSTPG